MAFLKAEIPVFSNAKNYRRDPLVPLVVPTVNLPHLDLIPHQRSVHKLSKGFLVCNSNCAVIGLVIPFAALQAAFGPISTVSIVTMQAVSGAGYPGVSSMDIMDNVVPFISGEEDKLETEARKILGSIDDGRTAFIEQSNLRVSASCNRVPVMDGHTACVSLKFERQPPPSAEECKAALREYVSEAQKLGCPSAPNPPIKVFDEDDRPQPRLDRDLGRGYTVSVGRVREDESGIFDLKFVALSHNSKPFSSYHSCRVDTADTLYSGYWSGWFIDIKCRGRHPQGLYLIMFYLLISFLGFFGITYVHIEDKSTDEKNLLHMTIAQYYWEVKQSLCLIKGVSTYLVLEY
jgi:aspartate-semialdehyde dehydrogenase